MFKAFTLALAVLALALFYNFDISDVLKSFKKFREVKKNDDVLHHVFYTDQGEYYFFESIKTELERVKSEQIPTKEIATGDWDLMWSHSYITLIPIDFTKLRKGQKINHIPGIFHIASKSHLAALTTSKYIPKGFLTAVESMEYIVFNKNKRFLLKDKSSRGIILRNPFEMNFENEEEFHGSFAQEYIEDPMLINGHKFEFSVFVAITSIDPLRVYIYEKDIELQFTSKPYDSKIVEDVDSYIIGDSFISGADFPAIKKYFNQSLTFKEALNTILRKKGVKVQKVWEDVEDCIRTVVSDKEKDFIREVRKSFEKFIF